jgi:hypothetical protein
MFHPVDLVAPIGITVLAAVLCGLGIARAEKRAAKVVCALTAAVFLAGIPALYFMRWSARSCDYEVENIRVRQGKLNRCEKAQIAADVVWVRSWWQKHCPSKMAAVRRQLDDRLLVCVDQEKLGAAGRWARGYIWGSVVVVGWNGDLDYTKSLIRHELSHLAAVGCGYPLDEEEHHKLFAKLQLGY